MTTDDAQAPGILLIHGFWHGAWCWNGVAARLTAVGRRVLAVDMAGHGLRARLPASATARPFDAQAFATEVSPLASVDLDEAGDLLVAQIEEFSGGRPVVVVANSFGGVVLTRAVQTVPHLVHHAVYLTAVMPASGVPGAAYLSESEQSGDRVAPLFKADPAVIGALRLDTRSDGDREAIRQAWYADADPALADAAIALLTTDAPVGIATGSTVLTQDAWGSVPRTFLYTSDDWSLRPALQRRFIAEADAAFPDNPTTVVELESSHAPFLSQPDVVADLIASVR